MTANVAMWKQQKPHSERLRNLKNTDDTPVIAMIRSRSMGWPANVILIPERRNVYKIMG
jgi:hypothetical protein